jgi:tetratricopeptide (TPR) repeat protein
VTDLLRDANRASQRGRFADAARVASRILGLEPKNVDALRIRAMSRFQLRLAAADPDAATHLERALFKDSDRLVELQPGRAWPHAMRAHLLRRLGRGEEAERADALAAQLRSDEVSEEELQIEAWAASDRGDYDMAVERLEEVVLRKPGRAEPLAYLGDMQMQRGDLDAAIENYRLALGFRPDEVHYAIELARVYTLRGRLDEGTRLLEQVLEREPDSADAYQVLAHNLMAHGQVADGPAAAGDFFRRAEMAARRGLELDPRSAWGRINLGMALINRNRLLDYPKPELVEEAVRWYEDALALWPTPPVGEGFDAYVAAVVNSCEALIELGALDRALAACARATDRFPAAAVDFYNLAGVYALLGRGDDAFAALERDFDLGDRDWEYLVDDPWFAELRGDLRFADLVRRMKQPPED